MEYLCEPCNKKYKSYQSLWNHHHKYHNDSKKPKSAFNQPNISQISAFNQPNISQKSAYNQPTKFSCRYCKKYFIHIQSRWRHENKCQNEKTVNDNIRNEIKLELKNELKNEIKNELKHEIKNNSKSTTNIKVQGNVINGNNHDSGPKQIIYKTGTENVDLLNYDEVSTIFDNEISSVIKLIELVNFSENKPQNHSFCSTALESPYLSFYNTNTNSVNKERKRYFFEDVICKSIQNHEILYSKFKHKFNLTKRKQIEDNIANLKKIKENSFSSKIINEMISNLNLLSYNKRDLIQDTWAGKKYDNESDEEFMSMLLDNPEAQRIIAENKKKEINKSKSNSYNNSDDNSDDNSNDDSDDDRPMLLPFISNKNKLL